MAKKIKSMPPAPAAKVTAAPVVTPAPAPVAEKSEVKGLGKPKTPVSAPKTITHDDIARRAYEIYANRGYTPGDQNADWCEAERQLKAGL